MFHLGFIYYLILLQIEKALAIIDVQTIDFQEIQNQCWSKFYSFVQQCYQVSVIFLLMSYQDRQLTKLFERLCRSSFYF